MGGGRSRRRDRRRDAEVDGTDAPTGDAPTGEAPTGDAPTGARNGKVEAGRIAVGLETLQVIKVEEATTVAAPSTGQAGR